jgi:hypothetical protein
MSRKQIPFGSMPIFSRHLAQPFEEWSSSGRKVVVSGCEAEKPFFLPVVPSRCCDGSHRFRNTSLTIVHSISGNAWPYRRLVA